MEASAEERSGFRKLLPAPFDGSRSVSHLEQPDSLGHSSELNSATTAADSASETSAAKASKLVEDAQKWLVEADGQCYKLKIAKDDVKDVEENIAAIALRLFNSLTALPQQNPQRSNQKMTDDWLAAQVPKLDEVLEYMETDMDQKAAYAYCVRLVGKVIDLHKIGIPIYKLKHYPGCETTKISGGGVRTILMKPSNVKVHVCKAMERIDLIDYEITNGKYVSLDVVEGQGRREFGSQPGQIRRFEEGEPEAEQRPGGTKQEVEAFRAARWVGDR